MLIASNFFCQAEDGIRDLVRSRGLGDVYKRQDPLTPDVVRRIFERIIDETRWAEQRAKR